MASKTQILCDSERLTEIANNSKDIYLLAMFKEGIITEEQFDKMQRYAIHYQTKTTLGQWVERVFFKKEKEDNYFKAVIVKVIEWR